MKKKQQKDDLQRKIWNGSILDDIIIFTDNLHYNLNPRQLKILRGNQQEALIQHRTYRWRLWFESRLLRQAKKNRKELSGPNMKIFGSLFFAYRRALSDSDNGDQMEARKTSIIEIMMMMDQEVQNEVERARRHRVNERVIKHFLEQYQHVKQQVRFWLAKERRNKTNNHDP